MRGGAECPPGPLRGSLLAHGEEHLQKKQKDTSSKANNISRGAFYEGCSIISKVVAMLSRQNKHNRHTTSRQHLKNSA